MEIKVNDERTFKEKLKDKVADAKVAVNNKVGEAKRWCCDHSMQIIYATPAVIGAATGLVKLVKTVKGSAAERHEDRMENCYYDPSSGFHFDLKRELRNSDRIEILQRKRAGEPIEEILMSMKLLKK